MALLKNKSAGHFKLAMILVLGSIAISMFAFFGENRSNLTGFAVVEQRSSLNLPEYDSVSSLKVLAKGNYYIDNDGIVYWIDDSSRPAVAKVKLFEELQTERTVYVDSQGNVGYVIS